MNVHYGHSEAPYCGRFLKMQTHKCVSAKQITQQESWERQSLECQITWCTPLVNSGFRNFPFIFFFCDDSQTTHKGMGMLTYEGSHLPNCLSFLFFAVFCQCAQVYWSHVRVKRNEIWTKLDLSLLPKEVLLVKPKFQRSWTTSGQRKRAGQKRKWRSQILSALFWN